MDKVLTRKLFRDRYFKTLKPVIKHFNTGGISALTPKEKAIYAATLAAPLLQAKGQGLAPVASALGEGFAKLPATILSVEKQKGSGKGVRTLSAEEVKAYNLPTGTIAQMSADGKINIVSKPSAEQIKQIQGGKRVRSILSKIQDDYYRLGKPVGFADLNRIRATLGRAGGTSYSKDYASMKAKIQQATSFITQAISGAAVSEQEAKRIQKLIPQLGDTEATFEGKMKALDGYFADAIKIAENNNADFVTAMEIMEQSGRGAENYLDLAGEVSLVKEGDVIDVTRN